MPEAFVVSPRRPRPAPLPAPAPAEVPPPMTAMRDSVLAPFGRFLEDPDVTDLFVNGADGLFVDRGDGPRRVREWRAVESDVRGLAVAPLGDPTTTRLNLSPSSATPQPSFPCK